MNVARRGGVVLAMLLLNAAVGQAHTLASTIVSVTMTHPDTVTITIAAEADPLIAKLEALAGIAASDPAATRADRRARIESLFPTLRAHIDARIGGAPLVVELQDVTVDDTAQTELRLTAKRPAGPDGDPHEDRGAFTWRCTFIFGAYQFASGDEVEGIQWLQGSQASTPIALQPSRPRDYSSARDVIRIGHSLAMGALVVYVIRRRAAVTRYSESERDVGSSRRAGHCPLSVRGR